MAQPSQLVFAWGSAGAWAAVVVAAALLRSRSYAVARGVLLLLHTLIAHALWPRVGALWPLFLFGHATVFLHSLALVRPRMRPLAYRLLVSWPEGFFFAGTFLAFPMAIAIGFGVEPPQWLLALPYAFSALGMVQTFRLTSAEEVTITVGADEPQIDGPARTRPSQRRAERPLRIAQITDPHLGPFMSEARLRGFCERVVAFDPDLVVLTGDFLTMESQSDPAVLAGALAPLLSLSGKVFACFGNHDLEAPDTVRQALSEVGATLLVDEARLVSTPAGEVQVLGVDFRFRGRKEHLAKVCADHPRVDGALRLVLLHDPGAFKALPEGEGDLVLSGHTHGGQLGLVSLGLTFTFTGVVARIPDHGLWGRGTDRLYVHRGTGHYGFPVRLGVPAEESLLLVHR